MSGGGGEGEEEEGMKGAASIGRDMMLEKGVDRAQSVANEQEGN